MNDPSSMGDSSSSDSMGGMKMMMMGPMHMYVYFSTDCAFVFKPWRTKPGDDGMFVLGCFLCLVYAFLHSCIPVLKKKHIELMVKKRNLEMNKPVPFSVRIVLALYYFGYALSNIIVMMIMMTMDGYVLLSLALGFTIGYAIFQAPSFSKRKVELN